MADEISTLRTLINELSQVPLHLNLVFSTPRGDIHGGYHVTELKTAKITSIDCGGNIRNFKETHLQLLDGVGGTFMSVEKFSAIATKSMAMLPTLAEESFSIELSLNNKGLEWYRVTALIQTELDLRVELTQMRATCKPANQPSNPDQSRCCNPKSNRSRCCV